MLGVYKMNFPLGLLVILVSLCCGVYRSCDAEPSHSVSQIEPHAHLQAAEMASRRDARSLVKFPDDPDVRWKDTRLPKLDKAWSTGKGKLPKKNINNESILNSNSDTNYRGAKSESNLANPTIPSLSAEEEDFDDRHQPEGYNTSSLRKSDRKAEPDVQDIISGIVHLLGGKVALHTANTDINPPRLPAPFHNTRINNRGPPRVSEIPFEAIPLQAGNSANRPPFGPIRRPVWPNAPIPTTATLPFASGVPLPVQLVPTRGSGPNTIPLRPDRPLAPNPPFQNPPPPQAETLQAQQIPNPSFSPEFLAVPSTVITAPSPIITPELKPSVEDIAVSLIEASLDSSSSQFVTPSLLTTSAVQLTTSHADPDHWTEILPTTSSTALFTGIVEENKHTPSSSAIKENLSSSIMVIATSEVFVPVISASSSSTNSLLAVSTTSVVSQPVVPTLAPTFPAPLNIPSPAASPTPPLARPGMVFNEDYGPTGHQQGAGHDVDVITGDVQNAYEGIGETFELVVTAAQNFGGGAPPPGRPHIIPVNIHDIRDGLVTAEQGQGDQFVSIDGRKTYFNLFPTEGVGEAVGNNNIAPTAVSSSVPSRVAGSYPYGQGQVVTGTRIQPAKPEYPRPAAAPVVPRPRPQPVSRPRPTPSIIRKPAATTPLSRIDACIVGDPSTCDDPNEVCRTEDAVSSCTCRPGFGRRRTSESCRALVALAVSVKLDKFDDRRLSWSNLYADPDSPDYQQLAWESKQAIHSALQSTPLSPLYMSATINKFYTLGGKVVANATVFLDETPETLSPALKSQLQTQLVSAIQARNNNIGQSRLWVDGPVNSVPAVNDLDECSSPELNDCHEKAVCTNIFGSFRCQCLPGYSDPENQASTTSDPHKVGRRCLACTADFCHSRGECKVENGRKFCQCKGNYQGTQCEVDGEVLGVAIGASVAAVVVIVLTLVFLCLWSRRWRKGQGTGVGNHGMGMGGGKFPSLPYQAVLQDRLRWAHLTDVMNRNMYGTPSSTIYPTLYPQHFVVQPTNNAPSHDGNLDDISSTESVGKAPLRAAASLPVSLKVSSVMGGIVSHVARRLSRKKNLRPDPVHVSPNVGLLSPGYPLGHMVPLNAMGTLPSVSGSLAPTLPLGGYPGPRSTAGSVMSYGKRRPPPPPSVPHPQLNSNSTESDDSANESDAPIGGRRIPRPRPRSRASTSAQNNIYYEADAVTVTSEMNRYQGNPMMHMNMHAYNNRFGGRPLM